VIRSAIDAVRKATFHVIVPRVNPVTPVENLAILLENAARMVEGPSVTIVRKEDTLQENVLRTMIDACPLRDLRATTIVNIR